MFNKHYSMIAIMMIAMLAVPIVGATQIYQEVEIRASVADGNTTYDAMSFSGFWFDINKNYSSEVMTINITGERMIDDRDLVYTCTRQQVSYKNKDLNDTYGGYYIIGFFADKYMCRDGKTDELVKLLIEYDDSDDVVLSIDDPMELPEGYRLNAQEIDLNGNRVWLKLYKDGECVDDSIVNGGDLYAYEDDDDVLVFGLTVDSVFRGTESNLVTVSGIFLRSEDILDVSTSDNFGVMEVRSTSTDTIVLSNDESIDLSRDNRVEIMNDLYFRVADSNSLRYYLAKTVGLECAECPSCPELVPREPCPVCPAVVNATIVEPVVESTEVPDAKPTAKDKDDGTLPGFEAVFALVGLLAVSWIVLRQRE